MTLTGPRCVTVDFHGSDFFPHATLAPFQFEYQVDPDDLDFAVNRVSTPWVDLPDLVQEGTVVATTDGDIQFEAKWAAHSGDNNPPGAALRWLIAVEDDDSIALHLQGLPASAAVNSKPGLRRDDAPARFLGIKNPEQ